MPKDHTYPQEWLQAVPAIIFASLLPGQVTLILCPGNGFAGGGVPREVPTDLIPVELRMPNTALWISFDEEWNIVHIWKREE